MAKWDHDGPILEIDKLSISFFTRLREIPAVMDFSVTVQPGEAVGLVGESGCGKSTVALGVMQDLGKNGRVVGGSIKFKGRDLGAMGDEDGSAVRAEDAEEVFHQLGLADPRFSAHAQQHAPRRAGDVEAFLQRLQMRLPADGVARRPL